MSTEPERDLRLDSWNTNQNELAKITLNNPLMSKDIWYTIEDLGLKVNAHNKTLLINFSYIQQDWLKLLVKSYTLTRSKQGISAQYLRDEVYNIKRFSVFIEAENVFLIRHIDNNLFDRFSFDLKLSKLSEKTISSTYSTLKTFFNLCRLEGWLEINTYWFQGKIKNILPQNDEIDYIPEEVWRQLNEYLHYLPEPIQRMVLIIRSIELRIGELLNLPLDCLRQRGDQWRLRFETEKNRTIDELPIVEELVAIIKEQQLYAKEQFGNTCNILFHAHKPGANIIYRPNPKVMKGDSFNGWLNRLADQHNICSSDGQIWHFRSHQFRKTVGTIMTNAGVRDLIIQKYLRHRSPDMQRNYKHLLKKVLRDELDELIENKKYVDCAGQIVIENRDKDIVTEVMRSRLHAITTQVGECHLSILLPPCPTVNACLQCEHWLTSTEDLAALKDDIQRVEKELEISSRLGMITQSKGLELDRQKLLIRIEGLEKINGKN